MAKKKTVEEDKEERSSVTLWNLTRIFIARLE